MDFIYHRTVCSKYNDMFALEITYTHNLFSHKNLIESVVAKNKAQTVDFPILLVCCVNDVIKFA